MTHLREWQRYQTAAKLEAGCKGVCADCPATDVANDVNELSFASSACADEFARPYTDWNGIASKDRLSRRQQVICAANDADVVRPHQRSGGDRVFASGKYGKVGSRGVARVFTVPMFEIEIKKRTAPPPR